MFPYSQLLMLYFHLTHSLRLILIKINAHQKMGATRPNPSQSCLFYCAVGTDRVCLVVSVITIMSVVRLFTAVYKFYHAVDLLHAVCVFCANAYYFGRIVLYYVLFCNKV